ncbi:MAG: siderophore-interacting protein [Chitinophagaceae bacterium]|nr:siderophore-interacting protein [Chitinophagaceae bacterium]
MPSVPKWLGDTMSVVFKNMYHPVTVTGVQYLNEQLKKIRFEGDLSKTKFTPGNVVEFRVTPNDFRHYTPAYFNTATGVCEIIFYLHNKGAGSDWAKQLKEGDTVKLLGPGGKLSYVAGFKHHFVFGDETAIGLMNCIQREAEENGHSSFALMEAQEAHRDWIRLFSAQPAECVASSFQYPADFAIRFLSDSAEDWMAAIPDTCFYLTGRAKSILAMRKYLLSKGVAMKQIKTEPYWAEGKKGL